MIYVGIDPGLSGAVAVLHPTYDDISVFDTPTVKTARRNEFDLRAMREILKQYNSPETMVIVEAVHSMPRQGVASSFNFGAGYGMWLGLLVGLEIPYVTVTPQRWKSAMHIPAGSAKGESYLRACSLFPAATGLLAKTKDGRADALLLAAYGRQANL